jgi:very-short-patch-repair endonuclease
MQDRSLLLQSRAHQLRLTATWSEAILWQAIRAGKLGTPFRRQVVLAGHYIADFVAPARRLVVEVDGGSHRGRAAADARRDRKIERLGYRVLRLESELVVGNLGEAVARIRAALAEPP